MKTLVVSLKKNLERLFCSPIVGKEKNSRSRVSFLAKSKSCVPILEVSSNIAICRKLIVAELILDFRPLHKRITLNFSNKLEI